MAALRQAVRPVLERLEDRRLMSVTVPFRLEFDAAVGGSVLDKDGQGTGFTGVQVNKLGNQYQPSLVDLRTDLGQLRITSSGTASAGSNRATDNTLTNALEVEVNATGTFSVATRLVGPLGYIDLANEQGGVMFGPNQDNWVKLVAAQTSAGARLQFTGEQSGTSAGSISQMSDVRVDVGSFAGITTLDLLLTCEAATGRVTASYSVNGAAFVNVNTVLTVSAANRAAWFSAAGKAGLIVLHKNDAGPVTIAFDRFEVLGSPGITVTDPANAATNVSRDAFVGADLSLPNGALDAATVNSSTVRLTETATGANVAGVANSSGGGDSVVFQPSALLKPNTQYTFTATGGVRDLSGAPLRPYTMTFTTGLDGGPPVSNIAFTKSAQAAVPTATYTSVAVGPDRRLYAGTIDGKIYRFDIADDGSLTNPLTITTIQTGNGGSSRMLIGFAFDPAATAANPVLWVTHGHGNFDSAPEWSCKITRLTGANLEVYQDAVVNLPRAAHNHLINQPTFGPDGKLYVATGGNTAQGEVDATWGLRPERLLSAAVLVLDTAAINPAAGPLDVKTEAGGTYNPWAPNAPLKIYATGLRNAYDLVWTQDGQLYAPNNGSNPGGATPATPSLPVFGSIRIDGDDDADPTNGMYAGPAVSGINPVVIGQNDSLYRVVQGGYYGHPNPTRAEYVLNGGNPTAGVDYNEVTEYPVGTQPDRNYRGFAYDFGSKRSPNGVIEYRSTLFGGALAGRLLVVRYSGGDDIVVMNRDGSGAITSVTTGLPGMTGFGDPLDLTEDVQTGCIYVAEYGGKKITLLKPVVEPSVITGVTAAPRNVGEVVVAWQPSAVATTYRVQRKGPGDATFVDIGTSTTPTFTDAAATPSATFEYRVRGENNVGAGAYSAAVSVTTPVPGEWFAGVNLPVNTSEAGGAVINGKLYVVGEVTNSTWVFDVATQAWSTVATRPHTGDSTSREHFVEAVGGKLYVIGGLSGTAVNKTQIYDPATNAWTLGADLPFNAGSGSSAVIGGQIYVAGGAVSTPTYGPVAKVARYNPATDTWTMLPDMPLPRHANSYGTDGSKLYVFGGRDAGVEASAGTDTVQVFDPVANAWSQLPPMPRQSRGASRAVFVNGEFIFFGGESHFPAPDGAVFDTAFVYNPATGAWRYGPPMPTPRHALLAAEYTGKVYTVGGGVVRGTSTSAVVEVFDVNADGVPTAPSGLTVASPIFDRATLNWADNSLGETGFQILRSTDGVNFTVVGAVAAKVTTYNDVGLAHDTTYHYRVRATAPAGPSAPSNTASVTTGAAVAPETPTGVAATPLSSRRVQVSWAAAVGASLYRVERKGPGESSFTEVGTSATTSFTDVGLEPLSTYAYRVRASNVVGPSPYSAVVSATTPAPEPLTSVNVNTTGGSTTDLGDGNFTVAAKGTDIWGTADSFRFVYEERAGNFDVKVQVQGLTAVSSATKGGLMVRESLSSSSRMIFSGTTAGTGYRLSSRAATGASAANAFSGGTATFPTVWVRLQRVGDVFTGYHSTNGTTWTLMGSVTMALPSSVFFGMATTAKSSSGTTTAQYRFFSDTSAAIPPPPAAPTGLSATPVTPSRVDLAWTDASNNETGFQVLRSTDNVTFAPVANVGANTTAYSDTTVAGGTRYYYRVVATNAAGPSANSNTAQVDTPLPPAPSTPATLTATATAPTVVSLSWSASSGATSYRIERRLVGHATFVHVGTATGTTHLDTWVASNSAYEYRVRAENGPAVSGYSPVAAATTPVGPALTSTNINTTAAGSTTVLDEAAGDYDVAGSGTDIYNTADSFRYVYQQVTGNFDARVRVTSLQQLQATVKAGLVAREGLAANSKSIFSGVTAADGYRLSQRLTTGATTANTFKGGSPAFPNVWVRLVRVGNTFTGYYSSNGTTWTSTGSVTLDVPTTIYVGLGVASKSTTATAAASFRGYDVDQI